MELELWAWLNRRGILAGMILGRLIQGIPLQPLPFGQTFTISLYPLLCGVAMVGGYSLLGAAWLVHKTDGTTQTFAREVSRSVWLLTMASFVIASIWTPLSVHEVARRWFSFPRGFLFAGLAIVLISAALAFWRAIWISNNDARLLRLAVLMTSVAFVSFATTIWPYALPYRPSIIDAAADPMSLKFVLAGIIIVLPIVVSYQLYAYRVFAGKVRDNTFIYQAPIVPPMVQRRRVPDPGSTLHLS